MLARLPLVVASRWDILRSMPWIDLDKWYIRNFTNTLVPLNAFVSAHWISGPQKVENYNSFNAFEILGQPAAGYSSGQALATITNILKKLPAGIGYEWTGLSFEQNASGSSTGPLYALAMIDQPLLRGMVHMLVENGGVAEVSHLSALPVRARHMLKRLHIAQQKNTVFCSKIMRPSSMALRALLLSLHSGIVLPELPRTGAVSAPLPALLTPPQKSLLMQLGWIISGGTLIDPDLTLSRAYYQNLTINIHSCHGPRLNLVFFIQLGGKAIQCCHQHSRQRRGKNQARKTQDGAKKCL